MQQHTHNNAFAFSGYYFIWTSAGPRLWMRMEA